MLLISLRRTKSARTHGKAAIIARIGLFAPSERSLAALPVSRLVNHYITRLSKVVKADYTALGGVLSR
jgi:hypothetical protein